MTIDINNQIGAGVTRSKATNDGANRAQDSDASSTQSKPSVEASAGQTDVKISADAHSLQALQARIEQQESFDEVRVERIKAALANGEYPIDNDKLAESFFSLESQLNQ